jgi:hypothetical protein
MPSRIISPVSSLVSGGRRFHSCWQRSETGAVQYRHTHYFTKFSLPDHRGAANARLNLGRQATAATKPTPALRRPSEVRWRGMLGQRNDFGWSLNARVLAVIALAAMSIFCLKTCLGAGQYVLDFVVNIILWFGGYLLTLVSVPALFVAAPAWIVRRLRGPARSAFIENKARN